MPSPISVIDAGSGGAREIEQIQRLLDKHCLVGVDINPESRCLC